MKTHNYITRSAILVLIVSLFFSAFVGDQATAADPRSPHAAAPSQAPARLVIRRNPNLGFNVIVRLWIDGQPAASIGYGHTYEGFPGARPPCFSGAGESQSAVAHTLATAFGCAKRPDLRLHSSDRWIRKFDSGRPVWLPATRSVIQRIAWHANK